MATITSLGIGSGIDINSMVTQLVAVESRPIAQLKSRENQLNAQVSALGKLQSLLSGLRDAAGTLTGTSLWTRSTASSNNDAAVSPVGGGNAAPGSYSVSVSRLASPQTLVSGTTFSSPTALVGAGTITIELGSWTPPVPPAVFPSGFTPRPGATALTIAVDPAETLQSLRDRINALGGGVSASIVTDTNGSRLSLRSSTSGADNGFRVTVSDADSNNTDASGLSRLAFDPDAGATGMGYAQGAQNAAAVVNGIAVQSPSNELSGVIEGLTLQLRQVTTGTVDVAVASDRTAVRDAVQKFADNYNALAREIATQTRYDATSKVGGPLQGDSAVGTLLTRLRSVINTPSSATPDLQRLSDIGLQLQRDGTLSVNASKLDGALGDLTKLRKAFANLDTGTPANDGFMRRVTSLATDLLGTDGALTTRTEGLRVQVTRLQQQQARYEDRVERYRERLVKQFSAMDSNLSRLNALQSYVTQQITAIQAKSGS
jgi:flagellar hook-associated protein 2